MDSLSNVARSGSRHLNCVVRRAPRSAERCPTATLLLSVQSLWPAAWQRFLSSKLVRTALALIGALLLTAVWTFAHAAAPIPAKLDPQTAQALEAEAAKRIVPLMPPGVRVESVKIACPIEAGTTLKDVAPGITRMNSRTFMVELENAQRSRLCGASLEARRQVLLASHDLALGQPVSAQDFAPGWVDAFTGAPGASSSFDFSGPLVTTIFIRAGQPLYQTELAKPVAVRPGDMVTVVVRNGAITVKTALESRSTASIGDSANMLNPETGSSVQIHVTGVGTGELVMQ